MKVTATLKNLRIAPRKVRLVTRALVGMDTRQALIQLDATVKKTALPLSTLLKSAIANASNNFGLDEENLFVDSIQVGDGLRLQRWLPRAFGRATPLIRRGSHVTIVLDERVEGKNRKAKRQPVPAKAKAAAPEKEEKEEAAPAVVRAEETRDLGKGPGKKPAKVIKKVFQRKAT